jgi:transcriptional regulator with XRE-family HTH domain
MIFELDVEVGMGRFGEKLRFLRHRRGMTLRELADALGFRSHGFIGDLESGRKYPSLDLAVRIADFFGVPLDRLARDDLALDDGAVADTDG